jgi:hypothetical protein
MRQARQGLLALTALAAMTGLWGCDEPEVPRSDVSIWSVNGGDALQSSVRSPGDDEVLGNEDDIIWEDEVRVVFANFPSDDQAVISPVGAFGAVTLDRYRIRWISEPALPEQTGGMHAYVTSTDTTGVSIVIMPAVRKQLEPLVGIYNGTQTPMEATAHLEFWGEEKTSGDNIYVEAYLPVNFGLFVD